MQETPVNQASPDIESTPPLVLPTWAQSLLEVLHVMVLGAGLLCAIVGCVALMHGYSVPLKALGWLLVPVVWIVSVCIHEYGHVLGARAAGMTPCMMHIGPLQMWALNRGWRVRLRRPSRGYSGLVVAYANPYAGLRKQELTMTAAGPAANLIAAVIAALSTLYVEQPEVDAFLWGIAGFNLAYAVANLLPRRATFASDGMRILEWWKGKNEDAPQFAFSRLEGYSVRGVTADNLPADLLARLENQPPPIPLCHSWYVFKGLQNRHEWAQALELEPLLEERIAVLPAEFKAQFDSFVGMMRCEIAFSKVMAGQLIDQDIDRELGSDTDWVNPGLRPRVRALMAVRQGDDELACSLLKTSERYVSRSIDKALHLSEARIREAIVREMGRFPKADPIE